MILLLTGGLGCRTNSVLRVNGPFADVWETAQTTLTNQGYALLSARFPDARVGRKCGLIIGQRVDPHPAPLSVGQAILSKPEPWERIQIVVCPTNDHANLTRRLKLRAYTQVDNLFLLKGAEKHLPEVQATFVQDLTEAIRARPNLILAE